MLTLAFSLMLLDDPAPKVSLVGLGGVALSEPFGVDVAADNSLWVVEMAGNRVRRVDPSGKVTTVVEGLKGPHSIAVGPGGILYIADTNNHRILRYDPTSNTTTPFAGTGKKGYAGDGGPAASAEFGAIYSVAFDPKGETMVLADLDNRRVRAIDMKAGVVRTVAGDGSRGVPKDGSVAAQSPLVDPRAAAIDGEGNVYIAERGGHALRVVDKSGVIRTVAGTGKAGGSGDGGPALAATLNGPKHLAIDRDGGVLIADTENHTIRKYHPKDGTITRVAGTGKRGKGDLGKPPTEVALDRPHGVFVGPDGSLYIADSDNGRVLKVDR